MNMLLKGERERQKIKMEAKKKKRILIKKLKNILNYKFYLK